MLHECMKPYLSQIDHTLSRGRVAKHVALESVGERFAGSFDEQCADFEYQGHQVVDPIQRGLTCPICGRIACVDG